MKTRLSIIVAGAVLALSACGGGTTTPATQNTTTTTTPPASDPVKWTGAFCGGVTPVMESLLEFLKTSITAMASGDNATVKDSMIKTLDTGAKSLGEAEKKLKDLGAPGPEAKELHEELVKFFGDSAKEYASVAEQAKKLDPSAPDFADQMGKIGGDEADPKKLQETIKKIENDPKYKDAMATAPECVEMKTKLGNALNK